MHAPFANVTADMPSWEQFARLLLYCGVFGVLGIALLAVGFKVFELITPKLDIEKKLAEGNVAVGVMVGALLLAIAIVVYAAIA
jgi:putative membrane protein